MPLRQLHPDPNSHNANSGIIDIARKVDIIAVHGLNPRGKRRADHAWDTWRYPSGSRGRLWLRDDLPRDLPESRIFLYEYNSTVVYGKDRSTFIERANKLLEEIRIERNGIGSRPIIFLGHSMGGLLIKQALIDAHNNSKYTPIKLATKGLVFFATPHYGGDGTLVTLGDVVCKIAKSLGFWRGESVLETLKRKSIFSDIMQEQWRHQLEQYYIVSFWGAFDSVVPRLSARLNLPGDRETIVALDADHSRVCKFGLNQTDNDNFKIVRSNIRELYEMAKESTQPGLLKSTKTLKVLKALDVLPYEDCKNTIPERLSGTCAWFTDHPQFHDWRDSTTPSMLWVSADPGCGKSVLARYLADKVLASTDTRTTCYFFFKEDLKDQRNMTVAIRCIIRQIIDQRPDLLSNKIIEMFESRETLTSSFSGLWEILVELTTFQADGEIVCIMDAFDECEEEGRSQLIEVLSKLYSPNNLNGSTGVLKFLFTSRPHSTIRRGFERLKSRIPTIHLSGEEKVYEFSQDISLLIEDNIRNLDLGLGLSMNEKEALRQEITKVPHRTYLWIYLVFNAIKDNVDITKEGLQQHIHTLPQTVEAAYDKILCRSFDAVQAKRLLSIVVAATRPLSLKEIAVALAVKESHRKNDDLLLEPEDRFKRTVRDLSGCFITIVESKVYLLHQTAMDFLVKSQDQPIITAPTSSRLRWKHSLDLVESHRLLAKACIWYLLFDCFKACDWGWDEDDSVTNFCRRLINHFPRNEWFFDLYPFLGYSTQNWSTHYQQARFQKDEPIQNSMLRLLDLKESMLWYIIWASLHNEYPRFYSALTHASYLGLEVAVGKLLDRGSFDIESKDTNDSQTPLMWAAQEGHVVARLLLDNGANVNSEYLFDTPLIKAVRNRHVTITRLLLEKGANIEAADFEGKTPLFYAVTSRRGYDILSYSDCIVQVLLQYGANIQARDITGRTPLSYAAEEGCDAAVRLLIENGADTELKDTQGRTALSYAAENGNTTTIRILLEQCADAASMDKWHRIPLYYAIKWRHDDVVRLLMDKDISNIPNYVKQGLILHTMYGEQYNITNLLCEDDAYKSALSEMNLSLDSPPPSSAALVRTVTDAVLSVCWFFGYEYWQQNGSTQPLDES
ncbi:hypothetical protein F5Y00DRAFT_48651 [Daldinia vernicosa]|uniref:uncharacterized protein n=1 Tax=Daldinia vernicosa TaxID=114800 RepID=UPI0020078FF5|nr:uncharacterized protein F5Y00DRAFT_48651 [Daldinia vernicosa]KAI0849693.1 hypothetical protein F5Y00DRAFT_48651 [Daldinia vernicosa]